MCVAHYVGGVFLPGWRSERKGFLPLSWIFLFFFFVRPDGEM